MGTWCDVLPLEKKLHELACGYRLNLFAQAANGQTMDTRQQAAITPLRSGWRAEAAPQYLAFRFELKHRRFDFVGREAENRCEFVNAHWTGAFHPSLDDCTYKTFTRRKAG